MKIVILTLFPAMFKGPFSESILKRAKEKGKVKIEITDFRKFSRDKHQSVDDHPFGGGPGMVLKPEPIYRALQHYRRQRGLRILLTPKGTPLNQGLVQELAGYRWLLIFCGHYEGVDERVRPLFDREISIGDYVLTGGEIPAMVVVDSVARLVPGVVKEQSSVEQDSFFKGLLDYPHYTRPRVFRRKAVPAVLLSGNHQMIDRWHLKESLRNTYSRRPDLLRRTGLNPETMVLLEEVKREEKRKEKKSQGQNNG